MTTSIQKEESAKTQASKAKTVPYKDDMDSLITALSPLNADNSSKSQTILDQMVKNAPLALAPCKTHADKERGAKELLKVTISIMHGTGFFSGTKEELLAHGEQIYDELKDIVERPDTIDQLSRVSDSVTWSLFAKRPTASQLDMLAGVLASSRPTTVRERTDIKAVSRTVGFPNMIDNPEEPDHDAYRERARHILYLCECQSQSPETILAFLRQPTEVQMEDEHGAVRDCIGMDTQYQMGTQYDAQEDTFLTPFITTGSRGANFPGKVIFTVAHVPYTSEKAIRAIQIKNMHNRMFANLIAAAVAHTWEAHAGSTDPGDTQESDIQRSESACVKLNEFVYAKQDLTTFKKGSRRAKELIKLYADLLKGTAGLGEDAALKRTFYVGICHILHTTCKSAWPGDPRKRQETERLWQTSDNPTLNHTVTGVKTAKRIVDGLTEEEVKGFTMSDFITAMVSDAEDGWALYLALKKPTSVLGLLNQIENLEETYSSERESATTTVAVKRATASAAPKGKSKKQKKKAQVTAGESIAVKQLIASSDDDRVKNRRQVCLDKLQTSVNKGHQPTYRPPRSSDDVQLESYEFEKRTQQARYACNQRKASKACYRVLKIKDVKGNFEYLCCKRHLDDGDATAEEAKQTQTWLDSRKNGKPASKRGEAPLPGTAQSPNDNTPTESGKEKIARLERELAQAKDAEMTSTVA